MSQLRSESLKFSAQIQGVIDKIRHKPQQGSQTLRNHHQINLDLSDELTGTNRRKSCECTECGGLSKFQYKNMNTCPKSIYKGKIFQERRINYRQVPQKSRSIFWHSHQRNAQKHTTAACFRQIDNSTDKFLSEHNNNINRQDNKTLRSPQAFRVKNSAKKNAHLMMSCYLRSPILEKRSFEPNRAKQLNPLLQKSLYLRN